MRQEPRPVGRRSRAGSDIVSAVDETDGGCEYVIADISRDSSWISVPEEETVSLDDQR